jgi:hypothetical protein
MEQLHELDPGTSIARQEQHPMRRLRTQGPSQERPMSRPPYSSAHAASASAHEDEHLLVRVHAEFREMPGLTLTLPQAARLFSIEPVRCERLLVTLVHAGHLATDGRAFANPREGRRFA